MHGNRCRHETSSENELYIKRQQICARIKPKNQYKGIEREFLVDQNLTEDKKP